MSGPGLGVYGIDIWRVLHASFGLGLTPNLGHIGRHPCKQGYSAKSANNHDIEQVPWTPKASVENRSLLWQAKATADRPPILLVGDDTNSLSGIFTISVFMGLRPHALLLMFLALSVARPPYASFHSRRSEKIT